MMLLLSSVVLMAVEEAKDNLGIGALGGWASFGIAGLVLAWLLLVHLPAKDKQLERLMSNRDEVLKNVLSSHKDSTTTLSDRHEAAENRSRTDFKEALLGQSKYCEQEINSLVGVMGQDLKSLAAAIMQLGTAVTDLRVQNAKDRGD